MNKGMELPDEICPSCASKKTGVLSPLPDKDHCIRLCACGHQFESKGEDVKSADWKTV